MERLFLSKIFDVSRKAAISVKALPGAYCQSFSVLQYVENVTVLL